MRGQLRISETSFIVLIIVFLIAFGLALFYKYSQAGIEKEDIDYEYNKFLGFVHAIPSMPEFQCSRLGVSDNCIDASKLQGFILANKKEEYADFFGSKTIKITELYLEDRSWEVFDNIPEEYKDKRIISTMVSIYYPNEHKYGIGKLEVWWYL